MYPSRDRVKRRFRSGSLLAICVAMALLTLGADCRTVPLQSVVEVPLPPAWSGASVEDIDEAIWRAGRKDDWEIDRVAPGRLRGTRRWQRHVAVVSLTHDGRSLRITYEDSENLLHQGDRIHHGYDTIVRRLVARIDQEPMLSAASSPRGAVSR